MRPRTLQPISFRFRKTPRGIDMKDTGRAQSYRERARRLREKAVDMKSPEIRQAMEEMACEYERLAEVAETAAKRWFR